MNNLFNKELIYRIISAIIYVPLVIIPLILSDYLSLVIYLLFTSIIMVEINEMKRKVNRNYIFTFYLIFAVASFFLFLFLLITEIVSGHVLLFIIFIIWIFDTFCYLGGKIIGGKKLMPKISSGKTISGLISGTLITLLISEYIINFSGNSFNYSILFTLIVIASAFVGDTSVSMLKRYASIKDSSTIMPGHGGLLDRFDSFIMVFFILGIVNLII